MAWSQCFVLYCPILPGKGPRKHRHPYEKIFIILEGEIEAIIDGETKTLGENNIVIIPAGAWHEFKNCSEKQVFMINIHPIPEMTTEWERSKLPFLLSFFSLQV